MFDIDTYTKYRCCDCGRIFDKPVKQFFYSEYWGVGDYTDYYVSPCCHEAFDEVPDEDEEDEESEDIAV